MQLWTRQRGSTERVLVSALPGMQVTGADIARDHGLEAESVYIDSPANRFYLGKNKLKREKVQEMVRRQLRAVCWRRTLRSHVQIRCDSQVDRPLLLRLNVSDRNCQVCHFRLCLGEQLHLYVEETPNRDQGLRLLRCASVEIQI